MRFTTAFLMLATAIGSVTAAPSAEPIDLKTRTLQARNDYITVYVCSDVNLEACISIGIYTQNDCFSLNGSPVMDNVKSVSIPNGYRCRFWDSTKCNGGSTGDIQAPGNNDITAGSLSSVKCYKN
ncbi:hypothetical protein PENANT_c013G10185 [Penicillium antarcticum]|uniref:Uncharacterized protein n=1 Tax=Penicillium antarcticum TaxID=416450 RepID=A0A1V6Q505_9EURO|nr:uncharacterized protein N7508_004094 [Penicillium antarcticum]KAJ5308715.1 hypothetical protein N7508_004094 [Penicillium antarcticum]OQD84321.1 hypothetical protein PENANT_c013G10185 [Penicillium antarcticum]